LAIELKQLEQSLSRSKSEIRARVGAIQERAVQIGKDVQTMSHELHSSTLEYLGVLTAMRSYGKEFGTQQKVVVEFTSLNVPCSVPAGISLCLFRVLQESLRNAAKHSGANHFSVQLRGESGPFISRFAIRVLDSTPKRQSKGTGWV
jgi:signal transduction histidine kinase